MVSIPAPGVIKAVAPHASLQPPVTVKLYVVAWAVVAARRQHRTAAPAVFFIIIVQVPMRACQFFSKGNLFDIY
jgi:hypothetical protein